jgi:uncharacterized protein YqjF (DUF2071 family)
MNKKSVFLTATWEYLAMLNYPVPEEILLPYLPGGTQIDTWNGQAMVSVVGFLFNNTKVLHQTFRWRKMEKRGCFYK